MGEIVREGRDSIQDSRRSGRPHVDNHTIDLLASLLDVERRWMSSINRSGRADGVRRLPQIWQKVVLMSSIDRPKARIIGSLVL